MKILETNTCISLNVFLLNLTRPNWMKHSPQPGNSPFSPNCCCILNTCLTSLSHAWFKDFDEKPSRLANALETQTLNDNARCGAEQSIDERDAVLALRDAHDFIEIPMSDAAIAQAATNTETQNSETNIEGLPWFYRVIKS